MRKFPLILAAAVLAAGEHPSQLHASAVPIELVAAAEGATNKLPRFKMTAYTGGMMNLGGWYRPVVVDLTGVKAAKSVAILRQHDPGRIIGHTDSVTIDEKGIRVEGLISGTAADAQEVTASSKNGFPWQASIGANPDRVEFLAEGKKATVNGQEFTGPMNIVRASTLFEVSFVPIGADGNTSASVAANHKENSMKFEEWLQANGFDKATLSASKLAALKAAFENNAPEAEVGLLKAAFGKPVTPPAVSTNPPAVTAENDTDTAIKANRQKLAAEAERVAKIEELCAKHPKIKAAAIKDGWSAERTELEVVRADRPQAPAGHVTESNATALTIEAAVCVAGGLGNVEKAYNSQTLEAAHKMFRRGISLQEMLLQCAWNNGHTGRTFRGNEREVLRAAFSSNDIAGIMSNTANKFLLEGFMGVEDSWRQIAAVRPVNDFKTITSYRLTGDMAYEEVGPGGQLKHGKLGNESFTNQAKTYGKILGITRQDMINDDLGALSSVPKMLGRGAALKFNTVFWTAFLNNAAFFTSARNNYFEGAGTVLGIDSLTSAELLFLNQVDSDSNPLGLAPEILLVPNALSTKAMSLTRDTEIRDTTTSTKYTTQNPHAGKFRPVRSSYLSNSAISGYSTTGWYLLADPKNLATIEACFLNGQQNPTVESADADFGTLGVQLRGYHDFGVGQQEYKAGVKSKGAA
jgi:phage head maturation protease